MIVSSFLYFQSCLWFFLSLALWAAVSLDSFEIQKNSHRKICVRTIRYRGATSIVGSYFFSYISDLSNNRVHDKVCSPNFYCFKFIIINASAHFKIHHCLFAITTSSLEVRKIPTYLMSWSYYSSRFWLCQQKFQKDTKMFGFYIFPFFASNRALQYWKPK